MAPGDKTQVWGELNSGIDPCASSSGTAFGFFQMSPSKATPFLPAPSGSHPGPLYFALELWAREQENRLVSPQLLNEALFVPVQGEI